MSLVGEGISVVPNRLGLLAKIAVAGAIVLAADESFISCGEPDDWRIAAQSGATTEHTGFTDPSMGQMPY